MKKGEAQAVLSEEKGADKKKKKKLRAAALCAAFVLLCGVALALVHFCYWPLEYLWVKFSNPEIPARQAGELRLHFVDVGQGDAIVAEFPDGRTMIVDAGCEAYTARSALLRYINALGIEKFDLAAVTHPDEDHAGGMDDVLSCFGARKVFLPYAVRYAPDSSYASVLETLAEEGCETEIAHTFVAELSADPAYFYYVMCLSPLETGIPGSLYDEANGDDATDTDVNDASAVFWIEYAGRRMLLTGDISARAEEKLVADYTALGDACFAREMKDAAGKSVLLAPALDKLDFLKVAHHGSADSTSAAFLRLTSPEAAFIGVGAGNGYGHPAQETIARLAAAGTQVFRTDELGSIVLTVAADGSYRIDSIGG